MIADRGYTPDTVKGYGFSGGTADIRIRGIAEAH